MTLNGNYPKTWLGFRAVARKLSTGKNNYLAPARETISEARQDIRNAAAGVYLNAFVVEQTPTKAKLWHIEEVEGMGYVARTED